MIAKKLKQASIRAAIQQTAKTVAAHIHRWSIGNKQMPMPASQWIKLEDYGFDARWAVREGVIAAVKGSHRAPDQQANQLIIDTTESLWKRLVQGDFDMDVFRELAQLRPPLPEVAEHLLAFYLEKASRSARRLTAPTRKNRK